MNDDTQASAPAGVRMLTMDELRAMALDAFGRDDDPNPEDLAFIDAIQSRFAEVNGLKLAAMSATTKEN